MPREALAAAESDTTRGEGRDPPELAEERCEGYGPLSVERRLKQDGRALLLYTRRESQDR